MLAVADISSEKSREAFSRLAREHHRELLVFARALAPQETVAHDLTQDAFVVAWKNWSKFDVSRDFPAWMRGIIRNKWKEFLRKNGKTVALEDETLEVMEATMADWQSARNDGGPKIVIRLELCLGKLPETMKNAIDFTYSRGMTSDEAAAELEISPANLRKRLERARLKLKDCLKGGTPDEA